MPAPTNRIRQRLAEGRLQTGVWLGTGTPVAAEIAGRSGADWCLVDAEHGVYDARSLREMLTALDAAGCPGAVRLPAGEAWMIKQALDIGYQTVMVPMVDSGAEAAAAARAMRYPPQGARGLAAGIVRASGYGATTDYARTANAEVCLIVQAESRAAVDAIDAIAGTEGVDCVFIGPSDLAADMGHPGDPRAPEVAEAIAHVAARTRAAGKALGIFCLDPAQLGGYSAQGARFVAVASDIVSLRAGLARDLDATRAALG